MNANMDFKSLHKRKNTPFLVSLETHRQEHFVIGSDQIREVTMAEIATEKNKYTGHSDIFLKDGEELKIGDLTFRCPFTPGHKPESVSYACFMKDNPNLAWALFTGDALFIGEAR